MAFDWIRKGDWAKKGIRGMAGVLLAGFSPPKEDEAYNPPVKIVPVNELYKALFYMSPADTNDEQQVTQLSDFLKTIRAKIIEKLPEVPELASDEQAQMDIDLALGNPIQDIPQRPHIDAAQLTLGHLQACIEKQKSGFISIDRQILENYQRDRITIMSVVTDHDDLFRREERLHNFVGALLQNTGLDTKYQPRAAR